MMTESDLLALGLGSGGVGDAHGKEAVVDTSVCVVMGAGKYMIRLDADACHSSVKMSKLQRLG